MPSSPQSQNISVEEYLALEERASVRHEYVDGQMFAMTGVTDRHNTIALNIYSALRPHLRGSKCRAYVSDVKVRVEACNSFYYPDVMVSCKNEDLDAVYTSHPVLIIEVLSRSTATIDRREKVLTYRQIASLKEYLIVHQTRKKVELHRRNQQGGWDILEFGPSGGLRLESLPAGHLDLSIDAIYEDLDLSKGGTWTVREESEREWGDEEASLDW